MTVTLTDDELALLLQALRGCTVNALDADAAKVVRLVQALVRKLQPRPKTAKKGRK